jgi:putative restriction endonuclease
MFDGELDARVRSGAFEFLREQTALHGEVLPFATLTQGFQFEGQRVPLLGPQGIFKPAILPGMPLSIMTKAVTEGVARPYDDELGADGFLRCRYRGTDPRHRDNVGLRLAMQRGVPLVLPVRRDPGALHARLARVHCPRPSRATGVLRGSRFAVHAGSVRPTIGPCQSRGSTRLRDRAHPAPCPPAELPGARARGLSSAVRDLPASPRGTAGGSAHPAGWLALCKLHHAAFDRHILGITPALRVEVRLDILHEVDGPMLLHGLQGFQGAQIVTP